MKPISTEKAPAAIGPYSQAIDSGIGLVFLSGQLPIDPATGAFPEAASRSRHASPSSTPRPFWKPQGWDWTMW